MYSQTSPKSPKKNIYLSAKECYISAKEPYTCKRALILMKFTLFFYHHELCVPIYAFFCLCCVCLSFWRLTACRASRQNTHEPCNWFIDFIMISLCVIHLFTVSMYCIFIRDSVWSECAKRPYISERALSLMNSWIHFFVNVCIHLFIVSSCEIYVRPCINLFCVFHSCIPCWVQRPVERAGKAPVKTALHLHKRALCVCKRALYLHKEPCIYLWIWFTNSMLVVDSVRSERAKRPWKQCAPMMFSNF